MNFKIQSLHFLYLIIRQKNFFKSEHAYFITCYNTTAIAVAAANLYSPEVVKWDRMRETNILLKTGEKVAGTPFWMSGTSNHPNIGYEFIGCVHVSELSQTCFGNHNLKHNILKYAQAYLSMLV